jgi:hypothetical protein
VELNLVTAPPQVPPGYKIQLLRLISPSQIFAASSNQGFFAATPSPFRRFQTLENNRNFAQPSSPAALFLPLPDIGNDHIRTAELQSTCWE